PSRSGPAPGPRNAGRARPRHGLSLPDRNAARRSAPAAADTIKGDAVPFGDFRIVEIAPVEDHGFLQHLAQLTEAGRAELRPFGGEDQGIGALERGFAVGAQDEIGTLAVDPPAFVHRL